MRTNSHALASWFGPHDGSLFDLDIVFASPGGVIAAFDALFARHGGRNVAKHADLWLREEETEVPFTGPGDAQRVVDGTADGVHVLLGGLVVDGVALPDIGVFVHADTLGFDIAPGPEWTDAAIAAFITLLASLRIHGGRLDATSAGSESTAAFRRAIDAIASR